MLGIESAEWSDRKTLGFAPEVNAIFDFVRYVPGKKTVVITAPGPVLMPWKEQVDAILFSGMPGEMYAHGLMDVVFGRVNPAAKLTFTMPNKDNEQEMTRTQYPGINQLNVTYTEKLSVGYRWYDLHNVKPAYEFGFGLSYTKFDYHNLTINNKSLTFNLRNIGDVQGSEIAQVYIKNPESDSYKDYETVKTLKSFIKVDLMPGQDLQVQVDLDDRTFQYWDIDSKSWVIESGSYGVLVGASSRDIRLVAQVEI